jgi:hypothetical protein
MSEEDKNSRRPLTDRRQDWRPSMSSLAIGGQLPLLVSVVRKRRTGGEIIRKSSAIKKKLDEGFEYFPVGVLT